MNHARARLAMSKGNLAVIAFEVCDGDGRVLHATFAVFCGTSCLASFASLTDAIECLENELDLAVERVNTQWVVMDESGNKAAYEGLQEAKKQFEKRMTTLGLDKLPASKAKNWMLEEAIAETTFSAWLEEQKPIDAPAVVPDQCIDESERFSPG